MGFSLEFPQRHRCCLSNSLSPRTIMSKAPKPSCDVFISCDEDTFYGFTGHLRQYFGDRGFSTFSSWEGSSFETGEAIKKCRIFILVLSKGFPSSPSCLDELHRILDVFSQGILSEESRLGELDLILDEFTKGVLSHDCASSPPPRRDELDLMLAKFTKGNHGRRIFPVFYKVTPSDIRHQKESYELSHHSNCERIRKWTRALRIVTAFYGWHIDWAKDKYEYQYIEEIHQEVSKHLPCSIGLHRRVLDVLSHLDSESDYEVSIMGICGVPGVGKSTVARAVFLQYSTSNGFDCYTFLDKVGEFVSEDEFEQRVISKIVGDHNAIFGNVNEGPGTKYILKQKKLFLIIEDVDDPKLLKAISKLTDWFGSGSKVIITAKDKCLLESHRIKKIYEVERFNKTEAFQLLSLKAFNCMDFSTIYVTILERAYSYASGLPLVLEVIGSHLGGKTSKECECVLEKYKVVTNKETHKILKVRFDALDQYQQDILIHIAMLKEKKLEEVELSLAIFDGCPRKNIAMLVDKSLIKINELGEVTLHDLTRTCLEIMSHEIFEEHNNQEIQPAANGDGSLIHDSVELEYQLCSPSSSEDGL